MPSSPARSSIVVRLKPRAMNWRRAAATIRAATGSAGGQARADAGVADTEDGRLEVKKPRKLEKSFKFPGKPELLFPRRALRVGNKKAGREGPA